jgi:hypothetical protein
VYYSDGRKDGIQSEMTGELIIISSMMIPDQTDQAAHSVTNWEPGGLADVPQLNRKHCMSKMRKRCSSVGIERLDSGFGEEQLIMLEPYIERRLFLSPVTSLLRLGCLGIMRPSMICC